MRWTSKVVNPREVVFSRAYIPCDIESVTISVITGNIYYIQCDIESVTRSVITGNIYYIQCDIESITRSVITGNIYYIPCDIESVTRSVITGNPVPCKQGSLSSASAKGFGSSIPLPSDIALTESQT